MISLLKKPVVWLVLVIVLIIGFLVLVLQSNNSKNLQSLPSKVSEKQKPGPKSGTCLILEQEFCSQAERVVFTHEYLDPPVSETYIAFNLPEGIPIFSPVDGLVEPLEESGDPFSGLLLWLRYQGRYDTKIAPFFRGDIRVDSMVQRNVKAGDVIGYTGNTGVRNLGAGLLFTVGMETPDGPATNEEFLRDLFH